MLYKVIPEDPAIRNIANLLASELPGVRVSLLHTMEVHYKRDKLIRFCMYHDIHYIEDTLCSS
jgi:hypothetical protein